MRARLQAGRFLAFPLLVVGAALSLGAQSMAVTTSGGSAKAIGRTVGTVRPRSVGELDCNGLSPIQRPAKPAIGCLDPRGSWGGRFYENGHYIGHDEPSVRFLSNQPGSGNNFSMTETLPRDPGRRPAVSTPGK